MAKLKVKKYQNNNDKMPQIYGKYFGRIEPIGVLDTLDLAKHIQKHGSIYTRDVVVGVLEKFSMCIQELLQEGYRVKLNGLGTFFLSVKSTGANTSDDYSLQKNIKKVSIKFTADRSKDYEWSSAMQTLQAQFAIAGENDATSGSTSGGSDSGGNNGGSGTDPIEDRP